jgi:prepilin-type N-terminal cleavage/methylation domain-containing protein
MNKHIQSGMTLIELSVVLLILVALAGLAVPYVVGTGSKALCEATDLSMQNLKKIIMEHYYLDTLGKFPAMTYGGNDYNLTALFTKPTNAPGFNPDTKTGWRGPYVQSGVTLDANTGNNADNLDASFKDSLGLNPHVHSNPVDGQSVVLDGWGRPIILQVDTSSTPYQARLVSAGPGNGIGLSEGRIDTLISSPSAHGDDRMLNLQGPTSANSPCDQF